MAVDQSCSSFPVNLKLTGSRCLVVGGGGVAERKVASLLETGAKITVVSPRASDVLRCWGESGRIHWIEREFQPGDEVGYRLVFCATNSAQVNEQVANKAKEAGALVNVADRPDCCDFAIPARFSRGDLIIAVSTEGQSPALARELRNELAQRIGPEYGEYLELAAKVRKQWMNECHSSRVRCQRWREVRGFEPDILELLRQGRKEEAEVRYRDVVGCSGA